MSKTVIVTGGSRGIGQAIALRYALAKYNLIILTKDSPDNIKQTEDQIHTLGGNALIHNIDISDLKSLKEAIANGIERFKTLDILINNTSATCFTHTLNTTPEQFDLVIATSVRAAFFASQISQPHLKKSSNPHIVNIAPPLNIDPNHFKDHLAFSLSKYAMSFCTLGMAAEFKPYNIAVNSLWPETTIATPTIQEHFSPQVYASSRWPSIMADAAFELTSRSSKQYSGHFYTDESLLKESGITDFSLYAVDETTTQLQSLFLPSSSNHTPLSKKMFLNN